jgi:HMG (high mobility group) box
MLIRFLSSAFLFFTQKKRGEVQAANPTMKNTEVSRVLGEIWRKMTPEEKAPHLEVEMKARERYKAALAQWKDQVQDQQDAKCAEQRVEEASPSLFANDLLSIHPNTIGGMMHSYLMQQTYGFYGTS